MGKFGIGVRVRDDEGDKGVIVDKMKGGRLVKFDHGDSIWMRKDELEVVGLALREGGYYRTRGGEVVGPMEHRGNFAHGWSDGSRYWAKCGTYNLNYEDTDDEDIVAEVATPAKFKPGMTCSGKSGRVYTLVDNSDNEFWPLRENVDQFVGSRFRKTDGTAWTGHSDGGDDLVSEVEAAPEPSSSSLEKGDIAFSVGDRVRVVDPLTFRVGTRIGDTGVVTGFDGGHIVIDLTHATDGVIDQICTPDNIEPAPLKLEAGKFYKTRDGRRVGPMRETDDDNDRYPMRADGGPNHTLYVRADGTINLGMSEEHHGAWDIIDEWVEPAIAEAAPEPVTEFKVGDRVRLTEVNTHVEWGDKGEIGIVSRVCHGGDLLVDFTQHGEWYTGPSRLEPAPLSIGDKVTVTGTVTSTGPTTAEITFANDDFATISLADIKAA